MISFLGSIGLMMKGSGLEEALENVYGANVMTHMMSGKAIFRALRENFLVEAALVNKLLLICLKLVALTFLLTYLWKKKLRLIMIYKTYCTYLMLLSYIRSVVYTKREIHKICSLHKERNT